MIVNEDLIKFYEEEQRNQKYKEVIDKAIEYNKNNINSQTLYKILKEEH